jgi:K+/H+ antiporter YhaU regulatory subunit KhtT
MLFNPGPETRIMASDILIVLGATDHILGLAKEM